MKKLLIFLSLVLLSSSLFAQVTAVTLQVTDTPDNQTWNLGSWQVQLKPLTGTIDNTKFFISGTTTPVPNIRQVGNLTATGSGFSPINLTPNASIDPTGTMWTFTVCPQASWPCYSQDVFIFGATQTLTLTPPSIRITTAGTNYRTLAYNDLELLNAPQGSQYYNVTANTLEVCTSKVCNNAGWTTSGGGGGGGVSSVSSGNLVPLFTSTVNNATTTPAIVYTLTNSAANTVYGNFTGASAGPLYNVVAACGDGTHALSWVAGTGFGCQTITGGVTSVSNVDGTLTITPTTGAVVASLNLGNANIWTTTQTFTSIIDSAIATSTSPICPNGAGGAFTTTGCTGGGGGGISGLTTGYIPQAGSPTTIINTNPVLDNGITAVNTLSYAGAGGIQTQSATNPGDIALIGNTGTPTIAANSAGWMGPASATFTAYHLQLPTTGPTTATPILNCTTPPASGISPCTFVAPGGGGGTALSAITGATATNTIANGNFPQVWNWAQTTNNQTAFTFGESTASTATTPGLVSFNTLAGSNTYPLSIFQAGITGAATVPAINIASTVNLSTNQEVMIKGVLTNTASSASSYFMQFLGGTAGTSAEFSVDTLGNMNAGNLAGNTAAANITVCGGNNQNIGLCNLNTGGQAGSGMFRGASNAATTAAAKAGSAMLFAGMLSAATPNAGASEGAVQVGEGYIASGTIAIGNVVCGVAGTTVNNLVTACPASATNVVGVATTAANPIGVVSYGTVPVTMDAAVSTLGNNICTSATPGTGHDNGTTACTIGTALGVSIADSGTVISNNGPTNVSTVTLTTSLVLVQLHIAQ